MKRFYKKAEAASAEDGFAVLLDGKTVRTPAGAVLALPQRALAAAIAAEWQGQGEEIRPASMPLMRLAATSIDHVPRQRLEMEARLLAYVDTDLLCLRADDPPELCALQDKSWQPPLEWLKQTHGIALKTGSGLKAPQQPAGAQESFAKKIAALDHWNFMGLHEVASCSGSLVLALMLAEKALGPAELFDLAELEQLFQMERWGSDPAAEQRHASIRAELESLAQWFALLKR